MKALYTDTLFIALERFTSITLFYNLVEIHLEPFEFTQRVYLFSLPLCTCWCAVLQTENKPRGNCPWTCQMKLYPITDLWMSVIRFLQSAVPSISSRRTRPDGAGAVYDHLLRYN